MTIENLLCKISHNNFTIHTITTIWLFLSLTYSGPYFTEIFFVLMGKYIFVLTQVSQSIVSLVAVKFLLWYTYR